MRRGSLRLCPERSWRWCMLVMSPYQMNSPHWCTCIHSFFLSHLLDGADKDKVLWEMISWQSFQALCRDQHYDYPAQREGLVEWGGLPPGFTWSNAHFLAGAFSLLNCYGCLNLTVYMCRHFWLSLDCSSHWQQNSSVQSPSIPSSD